MGTTRVFLEFFSKKFLAEREFFLVNVLLCPTTFKISKSPGEQFLKMPLCAQPRPKSTKSRWNKSATSPLCTQPHLESTNPHDKHCAQPDNPTKKTAHSRFFIKLRLQSQPIIGRLLNFTDIFPVLSLIVITAYVFLSPACLGLDTLPGLSSRMSFCSSSAGMWVWP